MERVFIELWDLCPECDGTGVKPSDTLSMPLACDTCKDSAHRGYVARLEPFKNFERLMTSRAIARLKAMPGIPRGI